MFVHSLSCLQALRVLHSNVPQTRRGGSSHALVDSWPLIHAQLLSKLPSIWWLSCKFSGSIPPLAVNTKSSDTMSTHPYTHNTTCTYKQICWHRLQITLFPLAFLYPRRNIQAYQILMSFKKEQFQQTSKFINQCKFSNVLVVGAKHVRGRRIEYGGVVTPNFLPPYWLRSSQQRWGASALWRYGSAPRCQVGYGNRRWSRSWWPRPYDRIDHHDQCDGYNSL